VDKGEDAQVAWLLTPSGSCPRALLQRAGWVYPTAKGFVQAWARLGWLWCGSLASSGAEVSWSGSLQGWQQRMEHGCPAVSGETW